MAAIAIARTVRPAVRTIQVQDPAVPQLPALTSLRFIAAVLIVIEHSAGRFGLPTDLASNLVLDQAVSFFFILSGFILTYVYPSLAQTGVRPFLVARIARIWPGHVAALLLLVLLAHPAQAGRQDGRTPLIFAANVFLMHAWIPLKQFFYSWNTVSWSISTEFGFYLLFPLLIRSWQRTWWVKLLSAFLIVCGFVTLINVTHLPASSGLRETGLLYINPLGRVFEFTLGMTTALVWSRLAPGLHLSRIPGTLIECAVLGLVLVSMFESRSWSTAAARVPWIGFAGVFWLREVGITCLGFAGLIFMMGAAQGALSRLLMLPVLVHLGEISFAIYLLHPVLMEYDTLHLRAFLRIPPGITYLLYWTVLLLTAQVMFVHVERPARRFLIARYGGYAAAASRKGTPRSDRQVTHRQTGNWIDMLLLGVLILPVVALTDTKAKADSGHLDSVTCAVISGWAWDEREPDNAVTVAIYDGNIRVGATIADQPRDDLRALGYGDGMHGFALPTPVAVRDGRLHIVTAVLEETGTRLNGSPQSLTCPASR
jgi:peptidoglycan/LPS O-acetylase OafA/YrhL